MFEEYEATVLHRILKPTTIITEIVLGVLLLVTKNDFLAEKMA